MTDAGTEAHSGPRRGWHGAGLLLLATILYFLLAKFGMAIFSLYLRNIALLWLPSGIGVLMVLAGGRRALPCIFLASFLANLSMIEEAGGNAGLLHTAIAAGSNSLEAWLAVLMLRHYLPRGLGRLNDVLVFILTVCLVPALINALVLSANLIGGGYIAMADAPVLLGMLVFSNSLGILLLYPLYESWQQYRSMSLEDWMEWGLFTLLVLVMAWMSFTQVYALIFLLPPVLLYQLYRESENAVILTLLLAISVIVGLASRDLGPFRVASDEQARFMLVTYLFTTAVGILGMAAQQRNLREEIQRRESWQFRANHDQLTGLGNRPAFMRLLRNEVERARRMSRPFTVGMIDIDLFKEVNDRYGHRTGDQVLQAFAKRLEKQLRTIDVAARYGGEEFIVLFPETDLSQAGQAMERVRLAFEREPLLIGDRKIPITISGGLTGWDPHNPMTMDELLGKTDEFLYSAKDRGRNRIVVA